MSNGIDIQILGPSILLIGAGVYALRRSERIALKNKEYIDSGEERYFEERRAWEAYGAPPTEPTKIRRAGIISISSGIIGLLMTVIFFVSR